MKLVKYRSNNVFPALRDVGSMFDHFFRNDFFGMEPSEGFNPAIDIASENGEYVISAELPGVKREEIEVHFERGILTLSGEKKSDHKKEGKDYFRFESSYGKFVRKIRLPEDVDSEKMSANFENGVLRIRVKKAESAKPKAIPIDVN
jgi:HSP20 family protein